MISAEYLLSFAFQVRCCRKFEQFFKGQSCLGLGGCFSALWKWKQLHWSQPWSCLEIELWIFSVSEDRCGCFFFDSSSWRQKQRSWIEPQESHIPLSIVQPIKRTNGISLLTWYLNPGLLETGNFYWKLSKAQLLLLGEVLHAVFWRSKPRGRSKRESQIIKACPCCHSGQISQSSSENSDDSKAFVSF